MRSTIILAFLAAGALGAPALADVGPIIVNGHLVTHLVDDTTGQMSPGIVRVFDSTFLPPISNVESTDEPGFFANIGAFASNSTLGAEALGALQRWNGNGFSPTTSGIVFTLSGQSPVFAAPGVVPLFSTTVGDNQNQEFDWHFFHNLFGPGSPGAAEAPDAIWLMSFRCWIEQPGQARLTSDPYWVVYNSGGDPLVPDQDAAIQWANDNLAPSPSGAAIAMLALAAAGRRRRPISRSIRSQENRR
jgi:hypothetical protein